MRSIFSLIATATLIAVSTLSGGVDAFTNGTLLPAYLCGTPGDGMPKTLGGVIALMEEDDAQTKIAGYHKSAIITAIPNMATATSQQTAVTPGMAFPLTVAANQQGAAQLPNLIGLLIWAEDSFGSKIGWFTQYGAVMGPHPGCMQPNGPNGMWAPTVAVHTAAMDDDKASGNPNMYNSLVWQAPPIIYGNTVTFRGLAVSDNGFGPWDTTFQVNNGAGAALTPPYAPAMGMPQRVLKCVPKNQAGQVMTGSIPAVPTMAMSTMTAAQTGPAPPKKR